MTKRRKEFLKLMYEDLTAHGVEVRIHEHAVTDYIREKGEDAAGYVEVHGMYFDVDKIICVDIRDMDWFETYLHEYMHFRQHKLNTTAWAFYDENYWDFDEVDQHVARFLVEVEAEQMVLVTNRMFKLGINEEQYIADANEIFETAYHMPPMEW